MRLGAIAKGPSHSSAKHSFQNSQPYISKVCLNLFFVSFPFSHSSRQRKRSVGPALMNQCSPVMPYDIFHSSIILEVILDQLHSILITGGDSDDSWNAFITLPLVCSEFSRSCRTHYRMIFGFKSEDFTSEQVQAIYTRAKDSWSRARGLVGDSEDDLILRYPELMANQSLIQIYICLSYSRRFMNLDVLSPLSHRSGSTFLPPNLKPTKSFAKSEASSDEDEEAGSRKLRDDNMHRLFMPLTCVMRLCDKISPTLPTLTRRIAGFTADIAPYYTMTPILLKYAQDLESYLNQDYPVSLDVLAGWVLQSLNLITEVDSFFEKFVVGGRVVSSFLESNRIPKRIYEVVELPRIIAQVTQRDWGKDSEQIRTAAYEFTAKLATLD